MTTTASTRTNTPAPSPLARDVARSNAAAASGSSATFVAFLAAQVGGAGTMFDRAGLVAPSPAREAAPPASEPSDDRTLGSEPGEQTQDPDPQEPRDAAQAPRTDRAPAPEPAAPDAPGPKIQPAASDAPEAAPPTDPTLNPSSGHPSLTKSDRRPGPQNISPKALSKNAAPEPAAPTDPLGLIPGRSGPTPPAESRAASQPVASQTSAPTAPAEAAAASGPRFSEHLSSSTSQPPDAGQTAGDPGSGSGSASVPSASSAGASQAAQGPASASASVASGTRPSPAPAGGSSAGSPLVGLASASAGTGPLGKLVANGSGVAGPRISAQEAETPGHGARGLASALKAQNGEVTLRLTPDTLGTVRITLRIEDQHVRATIETSTLAARDLLSKGVESLRAGLERRGLEVDRLEVRAAPEALPTAAPARSDTGTGQEQSSSPRDSSQGGTGQGGGSGGDQPGEDRRNHAGAGPHGLVGDDAARSDGPRASADLLNQGPRLSLERDGSATTLPDGRTVQALRLEAVA